MRLFWAALALGGLALGAAEAQTGLVATAGAGQLTLTWQDNSDAETAFVIERSLPNDVCEFVEVALVAMDAEMFVDPELAPGVRWCYRVRAENTTGASLPSNVACGTVLNPSGSASQTFTRTGPGVAIFTVPIDGYACMRLMGGTAELRIVQGATLLARMPFANPLASPTFTLTCAFTPESVTLAVDGIVKLIYPLQGGTR